MRTVTVNASKHYDVIIGEKFLPSLGKRAAALCKAQKAAIISDSNVWPIYGAAVESSLCEAGIETVHFVFTAGEASKNGTIYLELLEFLAENRLTRSDLLVALGGGVVGDLTGFAAATYLRGIAFIQVPTSLLAMVDSSVGGKTAIDLHAGKNLAGAFYQPILVLCDTATLDTLPPSEFRNGCAEIIKYSILYDPKLFAHLQKQTLSFDRDAVISRCIELKRDVVAQDEFDRGARQKLNLGHTVGHSIEALSNFTVTHGQAVAIGMSIVAKAAHSYGLCDADIPVKIQSILESFGLPQRTDLDAASLAGAALSDKKRSGDTVNLILPLQIGNCHIQKTDIDKLQDFIAAGL